MEENTNLEILREYQTLSYEQCINKNMMHYDYIFPEEDVRGYIAEINALSCETLVYGILHSISNETITAADIFQFSKFEDCTCNISRLLKEKNNPGVKAAEMGKLLLDDGEARKAGAYRKYGENHLKAATLLGLVWKYYDTYYLSCLGYVYDSLDKNEQKKLIVRLLLRNNLIKRILRASDKGKLNMRQFCYMLSDSTYVRRRSNLRTILKLLRDSEEYDFDNMLDNLIW